MMTIVRYALLGAAVLNLGACSPQNRQVPPPWQPAASLQELMQDVIDPSADGVWNAVETITRRDGETVRQPQTLEEWLQVRRAAIMLSESANLLVIEGRRVSAHDFPAEAAGALDSAQVQELIAAQRPTFNAFSLALRAAALASLEAIDARDPSRLMAAGGAIDQVCEGCHLRFWYPNQVIPSLPSIPPPPTAPATGSTPAVNLRPP